VGTQRVVAPPHPPTTTGLFPRTPLSPALYRLTIEFPRGGGVSRTAGVCTHRYNVCAVCTSGGRKVGVATAPGVGSTISPGTNGYGHGSRRTTCDRGRPVEYLNKAVRNEQSEGKGSCPGRRAQQKVRTRLCGSYIGAGASPLAGRCRYAGVCIIRQI